MLEAVVAKVPPPDGNVDGPLKALMFDSWYDAYRGVVILVRVVDGVLRPKQKVQFMAARREYEVRTSARSPPAREVELAAGEVGFFTAAIKEVADTRVGDTITEAGNPAREPLPGFQDVKPMVFAGMFPTDSARYNDLRDALDKLRLNDASFSLEPETSAALGFGFRCGFLGLLHMEIVQERLEREYELNLGQTAPNVLPRAKNGEEFSSSTIQEVPDRVNRRDPRADHRGDDPRAGGVHRR